MAESTTDKNKTQGASQPQQKKSGRSGGNRRPRQGHVSYTHLDVYKRPP
ncbi:hypothetical protein [Bittarella massiliensis (ex Durand et al. 2017)]|nr:hypothetical protein [Bittarella massiliensis (ex Durand et al. 2017)]